MTIRYFEDFVEGETIVLGSHQLSAESIIAFAREYDPQPMHTDPELARLSPYGGLIASGWQTAVTYMRLLVDNLIAGTESPLDRLSLAVTPPS